MANKARDYDNTPFLRIAGNFGDYDNDLTPEAKQIIDEAIASVPMGNGKPYSGFKIYYIVFNLITFSTEKVLARLHLYQDYHIKEVQERVSESTAVKVRRVATAVSKALIAAHKRKVKLFKVQKDGMHYIDNKQFYETLANAHDSGASAEELIIILQGFIDVK
ncbi:hypothetical protein D0720_000893 [Escherichia albertii]|nr:hypothetical protein [Escherichia albertii]EEX4920951.1 hypothetical protein [Escherichia albertii]EFJ2285712.1 hypothetical protein [Escherichia albertii]EFO0110433.1 hypothetical protein [Escherichia albertii]MLY52180.1 hypothetical protein [Escherichia albertii]